MLSPSTQFEVTGQYNRMIAGAMSAIGIIFTCTMTAFLVDSVRVNMDSFRAGRTLVRESGHTVLIGWNDRSLGFIEQICISREGTGGVVVVLVQKNKDEIERKFHSLVTKRELLKTRVIFRSGTPQSLASLNLIGISSARCVVLMSSGDDPKKADANTLRILIALRVAGLQLDSYIVAEVRDPEMDTVIKITGGDQLETIRSAELNAKVSLSAVRQPGIMVPYEELFGFDGSEFYTVSVPETKSMVFKDLIECFPGAVPIGIQSSITGKIRLVPPPDYKVLHSDKIVLVAEDENGTKFDKPLSREQALRVDMPKYNPPIPQATRILVCGWGENLYRYLRTMNVVFGKNTSVHLLNTVPIEDREDEMSTLGLVRSDINNLRLTQLFGGTCCTILSRKIYSMNIF